MKTPSQQAKRIAAHIINAPCRDVGRHAGIEDVAHELACIIDTALGEQDALDREQVRISLAQQNRIMAFKAVLSGLLRIYSDAEEIKEWTAALAHAESFLRTESREDVDFFTR